MKLKVLQNHDWIISGIILILLITGLVLIYSTTYNTEIAAEGAGSYQRQLLFILAGIGIYIFLSLFDITWLKYKQGLALIYLGIIGLLLYLVFFGQTVAETQRWIQIGFINIQPSEYAKIAILIISSFVLTTNFSFSYLFKNKRLKRINKPLKPVNKLLNYDPRLTSIALNFALIIPILVLVFIQPALGNTLILLILNLSLVSVVLNNRLQLLSYFVIGISVSLSAYKLISLQTLYDDIGISLIFNGFDMGIFILTLVLTVISFLYLKLRPMVIVLSIVTFLTLVPTTRWIWNSMLADYQKERVEIFFQGPESDRYGAGYQVIQSKIALGSGGLYGRGFLRGSQSGLRLLDQAHTDFIFAALGEQFGFVGTSGIVTVYLILILRLIYIASKIEDNFESIIVAGSAIIIFLNMFVHISMNLGILPVTGVPLPLVSYGGNSIIVNMICLGLVQSIYIRSTSTQKKPLYYIDVD